jgi:hypothetical protein
MATCENGKCGGPADIGGHRAWSQAVSEPTGPPDGEQPTVQRGGPVFGPGAERSTGRGCVDADDSEDEARRAAGGPGPKSSTRTERGALTNRMMAIFAP